MMIVVAAAVAVLQSPSKTPELARSLDDAKREFANAHKGDNDSSGNDD